MLLRSGYVDAPFFSLTIVIERSKEGCYLALRQTLERIERERIVMVTLPELSPQIVDAVKERGRVASGDIVNLTGADARHRHEVPGFLG